ncbi:hypothetical protein GPS57_16615 [Acinetobacter haemolyticus]|nr:hypothetical protein [Acinetobacter haemolyticus]NAR65338.1 hypothetical protein [Acinetobacter haemolyticus]
MEQQILKLYPIFTNNLKTFWQPYVVSREDFDRASKLLLDRVQYEIEVDKNDYGYYLKVNF